MAAKKVKDFRVRISIPGASWGSPKKVCHKGASTPVIGVEVLGCTTILDVHTPIAQCAHNNYTSTDVQVDGIPVMVLGYMDMYSWLRTRGCAHEHVLPEHSLFDKTPQAFKVTEWVGEKLGAHGIVPELEHAVCYSSGDAPPGMSSHSRCVHFTFKLRTIGIGGRVAPSGALVAELQPGFAAQFPSVYLDPKRVGKHGKVLYFTMPVEYFWQQG